MDGRLLASCLWTGGILASGTLAKEVMPMSEYEILNLVVGIIGLVATVAIGVATVMLAISNKNNRQ